MKIMTTLLIALMVSTGAHAATDGTAGISSTGDLDVSLNKADFVRITNLTDINFGTVATTPSKQSIDVCIYSTTGSYTITPSSGNASGADFRMANGGLTSFITYDVEWNNAASGTSGTSLDHSTTSSTFTGANTSSETCGGGANSRLFINVDNTSFSAAPVSAYTDTLTLVVAPI